MFSDSFLTRSEKDVSGSSVIICCSIFNLELSSFMNRFFLEIIEKRFSVYLELLTPTQKKLASFVVL